MEKINAKEMTVLGLVWQGLYDCQDDDNIQRGLKHGDYFVVWQKRWKVKKNDCIDWKVNG